MFRLTRFHVQLKLAILLLGFLTSTLSATPPVRGAATKFLQQRQSVSPQKSEVGDARALFLLGEDYRKSRNFAQALECYGKSAAQGFALAQTALGSMYETGEGVPRNFQQALAWYRKAAGQQEPGAENNLAAMYIRGEGTATDFLQAEHLLEKSAQQGWPPGQANLAYLYSTGFSGDLRSAYMLCTLALAVGESECARILQQIRPKMTATDLAQAKSQTWIFVERSAVTGTRRKVESGDGRPSDPSDIAAGLGKLYAQGTAVAQDHAEAAKWFRWAAERGNSAAMASLGELYHTGQGVPRDPKQAVSLFQQAARLGSSDAEAWLGICYQTGQGVPVNELLAVAMYKRAAESGNVLAMNNLAWLYATSSSPEVRNPSQALQYASKAVEATREKNPAFLDTLAEAYYANARYDDAVLASKKALSLDPSGTGLKQHLAKYLCAQNQPSAAASHPCSTQ